MCAVLGLAVFPAAHAHTSLSGKTFVHSHLMTDAVEHVSTLDYGEHHDVPTVAPIFTIERSLQIAAPVLLGALVVSPPEARRLGHVEALDAPVIHGPPLQVLSLRAPPA